MSFPAGHKHGTVLRVDRKVIENLLSVGAKQSAPQSREKHGQ
jgi:hypothetical protein